MPIALEFVRVSIFVKLIKCFAKRRANVFDISRVRENLFTIYALAHLGWILINFKLNIIARPHKPKIKLFGIAIPLQNVFTLQ